LVVSAPMFLEGINLLNILIPDTHSHFGIPHFIDNGFIIEPSLYFSANHIPLAQSSGTPSP
jgi:hypothetical protein